MLHEEAITRYKEQEECLHTDVNEMAGTVREASSKVEAQLSQARILCDRLDGEMGDEGNHVTSLLHDPEAPVLLAPDEALDSKGLALDRGTLNLLLKSLAKGDPRSDLTKLVQLCDALTPPSTGSTTPPAAAQRLLADLAESLKQDPGQCYATLLRAGIELTHRTDTGAVLGEAAQLLEQLRASDATVKHFLDIAAQQRVLSSNAKQEGRFGEADQHMADLCSVLHELFTLSLERCSILGDPKELDSRAEAAAGTAHQTFGNELTAVDSNTRTVRSNIASDKEHVAARRSAVRAEYDTEMDGLNTASASLNTQLQANEEQQRDIHRQLEALIAQLETRGNERKGLVDSLVQAESDKVKARRMLDAKNSVLDEHDVKLDQLGQCVSALEGVCGEMGKIADVRLDVFTRELQASRERIALADTEEKKTAYEHYTELYRQLSERLFTGERRVEELTAAVEAAEWRASISGATLDHAGANGVSSNTQVHIGTLRESMQTVSKVTRSLEEVVREAKPLRLTLVEALGDSAPVPPEETVPQELAQRKEQLEKKRRESIQRIADNVRCNITSAAVGAEPGVGESLSQKRRQSYADRIKTQHSPARTVAQVPVDAYTGSPQRLEREASLRAGQTTPPTAPTSIPARVPALSPQQALPLPPVYDQQAVQYTSLSPLQPPTPLPPQVPLHASATPATVVSPLVATGASGQPISHLPGYAVPEGYRAEQPQQPQQPRAPQEVASPSPVRPPTFANPTQAWPVAGLQSPPQAQQAGAGATATPLSGGTSPGAPLHNLSLPATCDELRKRAEELRRRADESRRRAQAHRDQASSISPRRPLYEDMPSI